MKYRLLAFILTGAFLSTSVHATEFVFDSDPFAGSTALITPGRQIVGSEPFIDFDIAADVFVFDLTFFGISVPLSFANGEIGDIPNTGVNVVVLRTLDNDGSSLTPFGAGNAANLIAEQITEFTPGFFVYFNSALDLPRLVYSTDLSDSSADLKVLARLSNLNGQSGALAEFTEANFVVRDVPEPAAFALFGLGMLGIAAARRHKAA